MSEAAAWRWCLAAGLVAFACSWGFSQISGLVACADTGGLGPILAFEFARTPADVAALFGSEPCRAVLVEAQRTGLWLDALGFIPAYTAFLCLAAWAAARRRAWPIIAALLIAGICDEVEGVQLLAILRGFPGEQPAFDILFWAVRLKFLLLGLGTLAIALLLLTQWRTVRWIGGVIAGAGAITALHGVFATPTGMMLGFTLAWFALLAVAAIGAVLPRLLAAPPPAPAPPSA